MKEYCFSILNVMCDDGINYALDQVLNGELPIIVCVGTDATIGDSLGPIVGTMLQEANLPTFIYGSLSTPVTAREITYLKQFLSNTHPYSRILTIDAAVGKKEDIGVIKIFDEGIKPGLGANKDLPLIGDASIIGIIGEKSTNGEGLSPHQRLGTIYRYASLITKGISDYVTKLTKGNQSSKSSDYFQPLKITNTVG